MLVEIIQKPELWSRPSELHCHIPKMSVLKPIGTGTMRLALCGSDFSRVSGTITEFTHASCMPKALKDLLGPTKEISYRDDTSEGPHSGTRLSLYAQEGSHWRGFLSETLQQGF